MNVVERDEIGGGKNRSGHFLCVLGVLCGEELPFSPQRAQSPQRSESKLSDSQFALSFVSSVASYSLIAEPWRGEGEETLTFAKDGTAQWDDSACSWLFVSGESGDELVVFYKNVIPNFNTVSLSDDGKKLTVIYKPRDKTKTKTIEFRR